MIYYNSFSRRNLHEQSGKLLLVNGDPKHPGSDQVSLSHLSWEKTIVRPWFPVKMCPNTRVFSGFFGSRNHPGWLELCLGLYCCTQSVGILWGRSGGGWRPRALGGFAGPGWGSHILLKEPGWDGESAMWVENVLIHFKRSTLRLYV